MTRRLLIQHGYSLLLAQAQKSTGSTEDHEVAGDNTFGGVCDGSGVGAEGGPGSASATAVTAAVTGEGGEGVVGGVAGSGLNAIRKARSRRQVLGAGEGSMHAPEHVLFSPGLGLLS